MFLQFSRVLKNEGGTFSLPHLVYMLYKCQERRLTQRIIVQNNNNPEKRKAWDPEKQWTRPGREVKARLRQDAGKPGEQPVDQGAE